MRCFFTFMFVLVVFGALAQDSLFSFNEVVYTSDFEKNAFRKYFKEKNEESLALLLAPTASMNDQKAASIEQQINSIVASLRAEGLDKKKPDKKVKIIYDKVHNQVLKKYELENRFSEVFKSGNYNCVTASALYALVFNQLGIPYQVKEEPTHVYLISYPEKENILVETTSPMFGYVIFSDEFKSRFVSNLKSQKIVGEDEADATTTDQLFNKYYFKKEKISLIELIGLHYMNDALFLRDHGQWKEGYHQLEKAYLFYPSSRCKYLLMIFGAHLVANEKLSPKEKALFVTKISKFGEEGISPDMIKGEFINLTQQLLFRDNDKNLYRECYDIYRKGIADQELLKEINYIYYYENGRAYYNTGNLLKAKTFFANALTFQPNNLDLGGVFVSTIAQSFRSVENDEVVLDTLDFYKTKYPSLTQFANFNAMLANANLVRYGSAYEKGKPEIAKKYKEAFDAILKEYPTINVNEMIVGKAYSFASTYYFRLGQKVKAREVIQEGLKFSPNNYQLRTRLQMIH
jgi:tetratricopeptide (TPR) repeat protein